MAGAWIVCVLVPVFIYGMLDSYEEGMITKQRFSERISGHEKTKNELETEMEKCKLTLTAQVHWVTVEMIQNRIDEFKELWSSAISPGEQYGVYRLLIDRIVYEREGNGMMLEVLYK